MELRNESIAQLEACDSRRLPLPGESEYDDDDAGATFRSFLEHSDDNNNMNDTQPKTLSLYRDDDDVTYDHRSVTSSVMATTAPVILAERQLLI